MLKVTNLVGFGASGSTEFSNKFSISTANSTADFTVPAGITTIRVKLWGAGGGGGDS